MNDLEKILERKRKEVVQLTLPKRLDQVLRQGHLTVIAEIKRRSPSKGALAPIADPVALAGRYLEAGAQALSILTDQEGFGGSLEDVRKVAEAFPSVPILRKDFIIDVKQIKQTARSGATAVLLIAVVLQERLGEMIEAAESYRLDAIVEVHSRDELQLALRSGAQIIGVNNRNLKNFTIDLRTAVELAAQIPVECLKIAESGIRSREDGVRMREAGFDAVLVGEALVTAADPRGCIQELQRCL